MLAMKGYSVVAQTWSFYIMLFKLDHLSVLSRKSERILLLTAITSDITNLCLLIEAFKDRF